MSIDIMHWSRLCTDLLVGWFGFVKPFRHYLELQNASDLVIRYAGNFSRRFLGAFWGCGSTG